MKRFRDSLRCLFLVLACCFMTLNTQAMPSLLIKIAALAACFPHLNTEVESRFLLANSTRNSTNNATLTPVPLRNVSLTPTAAPVLDVSGSWSGPESGSEEILHSEDYFQQTLSLSLVQKGNKVTGTMTTSNGEHGTIEGTISGNYLQFTFSEDPIYDCWAGGSGSAILDADGILRGTALSPAANSYCGALQVRFSLTNPARPTGQPTSSSPTSLSPTVALATSKPTKSDAAKLSTSLAISILLLAGGVACW